MDWRRVTLGDKLAVGGGIVLLIDLLFLPWHQVFSFSTTAVEAPRGWWGTVAVLLALAVIALTVVRRFTKLPLPTLPTLPRPIGEVNLALNAAVLVILVLKLALDPDYLGFGAYLGIALAGVMTWGASLGRAETDEPPPVGTSGTPPVPF